LNIDARIPPPVVAAACGAAMWALDRYVDVARFQAAWLAPAAMALLAAGLLLAGAAVASFIAARTSINPLKPANASRLITTGVFRFSRNPIYLADLMLLAAFAAWLGNGLNVAVLAAFVCYINRFQIAPEERALMERFGDDYAAYCARVRRWW
jgi:protein-S-isoprenylcysteine O-methyltransferase Ste14